MNDMEKQKAVENFKKMAAQTEKNLENSPTDKLDMIKNVLGFFVVTALGYGWALLMLLIISFVSLGYLHIKFESMLVMSGFWAAGVAVSYIVHIVKKYRR